MKKLLLVFCVLICTNAFSLTHTSDGLASPNDSLWKIWKSTSKDDVKINAILDLAIVHIRSQPDSAYHFASLAVSYAKKKNLQGELADAINIQGITFFNKGDFPTALAYFNRGLKINETLKRKKKIASSLNNIGAAYQGQSNFFIAIDYFMRSLKIREELNDRNGMTACLNNIGNCYLFHEDYDKAIEYYNRSLEIKKELGDKKGISSVIGNLALINKERGNYVEALKHYSECIRIKKEIGDSVGLASSYQYIGKVYFLQEEYDKAISYIKKSLPIKQKLGDIIEVANGYVTLGDIFNSKGDMERENQNTLLSNQHYKTSIEYCLKGLALVQDLDADIIKANAAEVLHRAYYSTGKFKQSVEMHQQFVSIQKDIDKIGSREELIRQEFKYDYDKKVLADSLDRVRQEEVVRISEEHSENVRYGIAVFIITLLGFVFYRFRSAQKRRVTENLLKNNLFKEEIKNKELEEERLNRELEMQNDQLTKLALDINRRREFVESLVQKLKVIKKRAPHEMNDTVNDAILFSKKRNEAPRGRAIGVS